MSGTTREEAKRSLLVVDDVASNIQVLNQILKAEYRLYFATDGEQALALAADKLPALILLDVMMPGMDGYEVCRRLKGDPATAAIPVIFVTAMGDEADETRGLEVGAVDYLVKPVVPAVVKARVRTHLALRDALEELRLKNRELEEMGRLREEVERITRHDIKSPLAGIIGLSEVLLDEEEENHARGEVLRRINQAGYRILDMVNHSLDLYKMESGGYRFEPEPVALVPLLRRVLAEQQPLLDHRGLTVAILDVDGRPAVGEGFAVLGEELLCYSLFGNLVRNALEATADGGAVRVTLLDGDPVTVHIHNQGAVPEAVRERFFDKYVTAGKRGGTGLGTYSARLMARTQHGSIEMESDEARGTTLTVRLPAPGTGAGEGENHE